ncbi:hypothetical protein DLREEDagrD3_11490 [Denitratisoma sp. agr-D3]
MNQQDQTKQPAEPTLDHEIEAKDDELKDSELEKVAAGGSGGHYAKHKNHY